MSGLWAPARFYPGAFDDPGYRTSRLDASLAPSANSMVDARTAATARLPDLVVVRQDEPGVYEYLSMRIRGLPGVELKLDQRGDGTRRPAGDRRDPRRRFNVFGVQLVRRSTALWGTSTASPSL